MTRLERLIRDLEKARSERLSNPPKRLSTKYRHYKTRMTTAEREMRRIEKLNRDAPIIRTKLEPTQEGGA